MTEEIEIDRPPAGTPCAACKQRGHFCPARYYRDEDAFCLACLHGEECHADAARRKLAIYDPFPDAEPSAIAEVRHIDPATVTQPQPPAPPTLVADMAKARAQASALGRAAFLARFDRAATQIPKPAPTPQPPPTAEPRKETPVPDEKQCAAEGCTNQARKGSYCTKKHYYLLAKELGLVPKKKAAAKPKPEKKLPAAAPAKPSTLQLSIGVTEAQCDELYARCTPSQKAIAVAAALQAVFPLGGLQ
jgi:hypothetical protein